jgi:hypothetical protein
LAGWIAHIAVETGGRIYLHRFAAETADNLLARKHITQVRILKRALHTLIVVVTLSAVLMTFDPVRQYGVPLTLFIEKPFQNWTRDSTNLIGTVLLYVDFTAPIEAIRARFMEIVQSSKLWDGQVAKLQVTDSKESSIELRALASARSAADAFDLRCDIREQLIAFLQKEHPNALPRARAESWRADGAEARQDSAPGMREDTQTGGERRARTAAP